jgi:hypothetical protein
MNHTFSPQRRGERGDLDQISDVCTAWDGETGYQPLFVPKASGKPSTRLKTDLAEKRKTLRFLCVLRVSAVKFLFTGPYCVLLSLLFTLAVGQTTSKLTRSEDESKLMLGNRVLLDSGKDGFMSIKQVHPSPDGKYFAVIGCGYECNDNVGFVFNADGTGKRKLTTRWDYILQDKIEWSADSKRLYYYRINTTGADPPTMAPPQGWVEVNAATGRKIKAVSRTLKSSARYAVFNVAPNDSLNVREMPS